MQVGVFVQIVDSLDGTRVTTFVTVYLKVMTTAGRPVTMISVSPVTSTVSTYSKSQSTTLIYLIVVGNTLQRHVNT